MCRTASFHQEQRLSRRLKTINDQGLPLNNAYNGKLFESKKMVSVSVIAMAVGTGTAAVLIAPVALGAMGFGAAGVAAGSTAAGMMSSAAVANGGGVAAGSLVAALQSAVQFMSNLSRCSSRSCRTHRCGHSCCGKCRRGSRWSGGMGVL
ncbi:uncharacterized protein LOC110497998 isoform X1 [Oncorhynchus mykiss]|uniref:uncharacterized protein LOC110497998 isoform X1 n=1 Tax=Oncorhynchus mykiss TaxID=8022 RepID=UPI001877BA11|nr:uncharacterized protein LOC110497998 isoform X1 [Oncorhynchus mykiss]